MSKYISKKWKRSRKKFSQLTIIVLALFIGLGVVEFPISSEKNVVHAASKSSNAGFSLWSNFEKTAMSKGHLYWGHKNGNVGNPMLWDILSVEDKVTNTGGVTLFFCDDFGKTLFNDGVIGNYPLGSDDVRQDHKMNYEGSILERYIDNLYNSSNSLNDIEKNMTMSSTRSKSIYQLRGTAGENGIYSWLYLDNAIEGFTNKKWFAPPVTMFQPVYSTDFAPNSVPKVLWGFELPSTSHTSVSTSYFWTSTAYRSLPVLTSSSVTSIPQNIGEVVPVVGFPNKANDIVGNMTGRNFHANTSTFVARPATNINITNENTVLITNADAKKSGIGANALTAVPTSGNGTYKLTLKDPSQTLTVNSVKMGKGNKATVSYMRGSDKGTSLSAIVTDKNDNVVSYGRIKSFSGSGGIGGGTALGGTTDIVLPSNFKEDGYKLKLFTEIYNGDNQTDYASNIVEATVEFPEVEFSMNYIEDGQTKAEIFHSYDIGDTQFGTTFSDPGKPSRKGYVFGGWYKDTACTEDQKWNFATDIIPLKHQGKMTLYAKWTIVDYSINYDLKPPSETNEQLSSITNPNASRNGYQVITPEFKISAPALKGYTFKGWTEKITVGGAGSDKDNPLTGESGVVNTDKSITIKKGSIGNRQYEATWQRDSHNVQIVSNGGTYDGSATINDVLYKDEIKIGGLTPPKGKKFIRWQLNDGSDATISGDSENGFTLRMGTGNVILIAIYEGIDFKLTFSANGGSGTGKELLHKMGEQVTLPGEDVAGTKKEATLLGWNTKDDGLGVLYGVGKTYTMPGLNTTLYAHWKINEYKLTLDLNGGTYSDSNIPTVITKPYQTKVPLTDPTPPDKKVFTGWRVIGDTPLEGGFGIGDEKNTYTMGAGDVTVQAQYKDMNQSIQFTAETETMLKNNTYAYGEEFEVEAEAIEVDGHLPDKTKGIVFSTQDTDYLEMVGKPTWNPSTFKAKATFKVVKPLPEGNANTLTIEINKPETDTHNAAQQVSSSDVKTEKRKIDLKIDSTIFIADKGEHRISLKAGEVMPDITQPPKIYKNGETTEDLVAIEDQKNNKIPYIVKTSHWLGNYTGLNGMHKDDVLIEDGKVSQKIAGNIWNLNIVEDTNSKEITWFEERYEVTGKSPIDAIVDVYDKTGNESISKSEILYVNNIAMSLKDYENKIANAVDKKQALINESNFKVTNMVAPYKEIKESVDSIDTIIRVLGADSHAGEYEIQYSLDSGSGLRALLIVADVITKNILADEELRANTYIHQKGELLLSDGAQGFLTLMKTEVIDLKTGKKKENMKFDVTIANPDVWKELGESTVNLKTDAGTEVTSKIIVRDHAVSTNDIRVSANDLSLSKEEATALVNELKGKSIKEQASILTPTDPESKYGMYPYATNYVTGNRVLINNITGLPNISTATGKVEAGVYDVTFETVGGGTVTAQIKVRTADPAAYVEIPAKIKLKKSNESNVVAEETDVVKLKTGVGVELDALKETILVETPSSFILKGISPSNTTTELNVDVYTQGENGETKHDGTVPFATLDSKNTEKQYILRIMKTLPKHRKDLYVGQMNFKISFGKAVPEGGG